MRITQAFARLVLLAQWIFRGRLSASGQFTFRILGLVRLALPASIEKVIRLRPTQNSVPIVKGGPQAGRWISTVTCSR